MDKTIEFNMSSYVSQKIVVCSLQLNIVIPSRKKMCGVSTVLYPRDTDTQIYLQNFSTTHKGQSLFKHNIDTSWLWLYLHQEKKKRTTKSWGNLIVQVQTFQIYENPVIPSDYMSEALLYHSPWCLILCTWLNPTLNYKVIAFKPFAPCQKGWNSLSNTHTYKALLCFTYRKKNEESNRNQIIKKSNILRKSVQNATWINDIALKKDTIWKVCHKFLYQKKNSSEPERSTTTKGKT